MSGITSLTQSNVSTASPSLDTEVARFSPLINQVTAFPPITQVQSSIITSLTQSPSFTQITPQITHCTSLVTNANSSHQPAAVHSHSGSVNSLHQPAAVHSHSGLVNSLPQPVAGHSHSASLVNPSHQPAAASQSHSLTDSTHPALRISSHQPAVGALPSQCDPLAELKYAVAGGNLLSIGSSEQAVI